MSHLARAREVFDVELAALKCVRALLDRSFDEAVELAVDTLRRRGKIVIVGIGKSGNIGRKIAATLTSTGSTSVVLNSVDALHGDLGIVNDGDLIIALSYSGESEELLNLLPALKRFSVKIIAITGAPKSSLGRHSELSLNVKVPEGSLPVQSGAHRQHHGHAGHGRRAGHGGLAGARVQAKGLRQTSSRRRHWPRHAAEGRRHHAHAANRNAIADENLPSQGGLAGDDPRQVRQLERRECARQIGRRLHRRRFPPPHGAGRQPASQPLKNVMTRNPIRIRDDALVAEALKIFNERNIDDLIVVNAKKEPVGMVDSQDLPKLKTHVKNAIACFILAAGALALAPSTAMTQETATSTRPAIKNLSPHKFSVTTRGDYLLFLPQGYSATGTKRWPLVLFLHGAGERGSNVLRTAIHGPTKYIEKHPDFPFIFVSPQCPEGAKWSDRVVLGLLDQVIAEQAVDTNRIYLTGLSMGGFGAWSLATTYPERFAAVAPICGGEGVIGTALSLMDKTKAPLLKNLPFWAFHGAKDNVVPLEESQRMVNLLKLMGVKDVKLTIYPEATHNSWTKRYNNPELYKWFLSHEKKAE